MRRSIVVITVVSVLAACSGPEPAVVSDLSTTTTAQITTTIDTTTSAARSTTSTITTVPTTTPALDRSEAATTSRLEADLATLIAIGSRPAGSASEAAALDWFAESATAITGIVAATRAVPLPNGTESANVWVGPIGADGPLLLVGSHIDSVAGSPGVDDNGSGIVILLELMRRLVEDPPDDVRVLLVAFGAEEFVPGFGHHYGSDLAADEMGAVGTLPDYMMSVDMVGVGDTLHSVTYRGSDRSFSDLIVSVAADVGFELVQMARGDISDHVPFAVAGVPSMLLHRGDNTAWHTPGDVTVEIEGVLEALAVVEAVVDALDR